MYVYTCVCMYDIRAASSQCAAQVTASQVPQPLYVSICQHMSAYVKSVCGSSNGESGATASIRQHMSAYVSIRQVRVRLK